MEIGRRFWCLMRRMEDRLTIHICELTYNLCNFVWKINMEYNLINFDVLSVNEFKKTKLKSIFINAKILILSSKIIIFAITKIVLV